jgi:hypothetical protein
MRDGLGSSSNAVGRPFCALLVTDPKRNFVRGVLTMTCARDAKNRSMTLGAGPDRLPCQLNRECGNIMPLRNIGPRAEYRQQQNQRANGSPSIADKFPQLRSLTVDLAYFNADSVGQTNEIKYTANLAHARSVFRFDCSNIECVGGDFDLSDALTNAYVEHRATAAGETRCQGWRSKTAVGNCRCQNLLRYTLHLGYESSRPSELVQDSLKR